MGEIVFAGVTDTRVRPSGSTALGRGIFLCDRTGTITKIAVPGEPEPYGGAFDDVTAPMINDLGDIAFQGRLRGQECDADVEQRACGTGVYVKHRGKPLKYVTGPGLVLSDYNRLLSVGAPALNNRGEIVYCGELEPRSAAGHPAKISGVFVYSNGRVRNIALPRDVMPDGRKIATVNPSKSAAGFSLNNRGDVIFSAALQNGTCGMYAWSNGILHPVLGTGTMIPNVGTVGGNATCYLEEVLNDKGQIFFSSELTDGRTVLMLASPPEVKRRGVLLERHVDHFEAEPLRRQCRHWIRRLARPRLIR